MAPKTIPAPSKKEVATPKTKQKRARQSPSPSNSSSCPSDDSGTAVSSTVNPSVTAASPLSAILVKPPKKVEMAARGEKAEYCTCQCKCTENRAPTPTVTLQPEPKASPVTEKMLFDSQAAIIVQLQAENVTLAGELSDCRSRVGFLALTLGKSAEDNADAQRLCRADAPGVALSKASSAPPTPVPTTVPTIVPAAVAKSKLSRDGKDSKRRRAEREKYAAKRALELAARELRASEEACLRPAAPEPTVAAAAPIKFPFAPTAHRPLAVRQWAAYLVQQGRRRADVCAFFHVCDRTLQKWIAEFATGDARVKEFHIGRPT